MPGGRALLLVTFVLLSTAATGHVFLPGDFARCFPDPADRIAPIMPVTGSQLNALQVYDGSTDVELFIAAANRLRAQFAWTNEETCQAVMGKMQGAAGQWLEALRKKRLEYTHFEVDGAHASFRQAMIIRIAERISELAAADAVTKLEQAENESVDCFHDRVVIAMDKKNFSYTDAEKAAAGYRQHFDVDTYTFFAAGLREGIRTRTMGSVNPPRNIADLLVAARSVELEMNRSKKLIVEAVNSCIPDGDKGNGDLPMEQQVLLLQKEIADLKVSKSKEHVTCYKCQKKGHFARECRGSRQQRGGQGFRRGGRGQYRGGQRGQRGGGGGWNRNRHQQTWAVDREDGDLMWAPAEN